MNHHIENILGDHPCMDGVNLAVLQMYRKYPTLYDKLRDLKTKCQKMDNDNARLEYDTQIPFLQSEYGFGIRCVLDTLYYLIKDESYNRKWKTN